MKRLLFLPILLLTGCGHRYSLREIRDYDMAIQMAESRNMDTKAMKEKIVEMITSFAEHPKEDPYVTAARKGGGGAELMGMAAMMQTLKPEPYIPPMSPGEYRRGM